MERYLEQLIGDLHTLYRRNREVKRFSDPAAELSEVDRVIDEKPLITLSEVMGIDPAVFPDSEKLTEEQAAKLARNILALWKYYFIEAVYPENFPMHRLYPLLVKKFSEKCMYFGCISGGTTYIEFCEYDPAHCPFGREYCDQCWDNEPLLAE